MTPADRIALVDLVAQTIREARERKGGKAITVMEAAEAVVAALYGPPCAYYRWDEESKELVEIEPEEREGRMSHLADIRAHVEVGGVLTHHHGLALLHMVMVSSSQCEDALRERERAAAEIARLRAFIGEVAKRQDALGHRAEVVLATPEWVETEKAA